LWALVAMAFLPKRPGVLEVEEYSEANADRGC
jgi:hypothetical protein